MTRCMDIDQRFLINLFGLKLKFGAWNLLRHLSSYKELDDKLLMRTFIKFNEHSVHTVDALYFDFFH